MGVQQQTILPGFNEIFVNPNHSEVAAVLPDYLITDPQRIGEILNVLERQKFYAMDTETTSLDFSRGNMHGMSFATADQMWYVMGNALEPMIQGLVDLHYHNPKIGVVGHNIKFDLHFLAKHGYRPANIADTMLAQGLVDENAERGLKALAERRLGYENLPTFRDLQREAAVYYVCSNTSKKTPCGNPEEYKTDGFCPVCWKPLKPKKRKLEDVSIYDIPLEKLVPYAAHDTRYTYDLWNVLREDLKKEGMWDHFWKYEMPFTYVLLDMEANGVYINQGKVSQLEKDIREQMEAAQAEWDRLTGGVNPNSTIDLPKYLFQTLKLPVQGKTETGKPSTDALTLLRLESKDKSGSVKALRQMRELDKLLSTYIGTFQTMVNEDGRIRTDFNAQGTVTGRLSSSGNINLQNIPARSAWGKLIRDAFAAQSEDTVILVADQSQLELRIMAHYTQEPSMLQVFAEGGDPHQMKADAVGVERYVAKAINFGTAYGVGPKTLCDTIEESGKPRPKLEDAKRWLQMDQEANPTTYAWKARQMQMARELGYVTTLLGRKRRLPDINSFDNYLRSRAERQSFNAPIQGSAADIMEVAMLDIDPYAKWYGARMLFQVHDELGFEVHKDAVEEFAPIVQGLMEGAGVKLGMTVKLEATPHFGNSWSSAKG